MSYYSPMQPQDSYYDPVQNTAGSTAGQIVADTARNLLVVGALNAIGNVATRFISNAAGNTLKKWSANTSSLYRRSIAQKAIQTKNTLTDVVSPLTKAFKNSSIAKAGVARKLELKSKEGSMGYGLARLTSAFKNPKTFLATSAGVWKKNVLSGLAVSYGVDSMLGLTQDLGLKKKEWYDVPGQVGNFGKWLFGTSIYSMAFGAAGPVVKAAGSAGTMSLRKTFSGDFGRRVMDFASKFAPGIPTDQKYQNYFNKEVLANVRSQHEQKFASNTVKKGLFGMVSTIGETYRQIQNSIYTLPDAAKEAFTTPNISFGARTKKAFNTISSALKTVKDIRDRPRKTITPASSVSGLEAFGGLVNLAKVAEKHSDGKVKLMTDGMRDVFIPAILKHNKAETGLGAIFGFLKPVRVRDVVDRNKVNEVLGHLKNKYVADDVDMIMGHFLNMKAGSNIYRDWRGGTSVGGGVDLSAFDPIQVMRRGASFILNKQFNIPFSKMSMSLGDLTGLSSKLAEKPSFLFFDRQPAFRIDGSPDYKSTNDMADLEGDQNTRFMYMNGKWAAFNGLSINVVDSKRTLYLSQKSSRDKSLELKNINVDRLKRISAGIDPADKMAWYNKIVNRSDYVNHPTNGFVNFLDRRAGFGIPSKLQDLSQTILSKITGKEDYKVKVKDFLTDKFDARNLPYVNNIYEHTSQVFSRILQHRGALDEIAKYSLDKDLKRDYLEMVLDDQSMIEKLTNAFDTATTRGIHTGKDTVRAVNFIKAFPKEAASHKTIKRLGNLSSMTSIDIARKNYIEDIFNKDFMLDTNFDRPHPLIGVSQNLYEKGIITQKEHNALSLHAKLSVFKDLSLQRNMKTDEDFKGVLREVRQRFGSELNKTHDQLIDFISNYDMRSPRLKNNKERIIPDYNWIGDNNPYSSYGNGALGILKDMSANSMDTVTDMLGEWLPFRKRYLQHHGFDGNLKYIGGIIGTTAAVFGAYRLTDVVLATNPLMDNTMFDEGLTGAGADTLAKIRMGISRVSDVTGVTSTMKYLHGLAPTSETTIPGMIAGGIVGYAMSKSPWGTMKAIAAGGILNRIASPYLPDMTKSHDELVELYSGRKEVPIMKNPTWLLGFTPWEGSKVEAWTPNWYVRAKSRWKETQTVYGSAFQRLIHEPLPLLGFNVGDIVDPYYMERKHYFSRPYPVTGGVFDEVPIIGKLLSSTIGRIIKPEKTMHQEFLDREQISAGVHGDPYPFAIRPPTLAEGKIMMRHPSQGRSMGGITMNQGTIQDQPNKWWSERSAEDFLYDVSNFAGLKGFIGGSIAEKIFGEGRVVPTLESAGRMASFSRSYSDLNLGGMGSLTEPLRRLIEKPEYKQYGQNPIPNMMPNWLPAQFLDGDPYEKLLRGELRLPGEAYLKTHPNTRRSMPARASMIGGYKEHIVQYFTGLLPPVLAEEYDIMEQGTAGHSSIQQMLAAEGLLIQAEALVNDVKNDITGHVDAIIRDGKGGKGRRALEIKTINSVAFEKLNAPKYEHVGQLNFYLNQLKLQNGTLLYINRENPSQVKTFEMRYSQNRWERDLQKLKSARGIAATMMQEGVGDTLGYSYSWLDRMQILADVAPSSKEFKEAKYIVQKQIKAGILTNDEGLKYNEILDQRQARIRKYELYPNRFKSKVFNPDTEIQLESINNDIKAAAEYSLPERIIGSMWENFTNTNTFLTNKFFAIKDPLEHYKMTRLYGKEYKPWDEPIRSWAEPAYRGMMSKSDPVTGAISFGTAGFIGGGGFGAVLGAGAGAAYGTVHGLYRFITNSAYIPNSVQEKREITAFFDAAKYERNDMLATLSTGLTQQEFLSARNDTMVALNNNEGGTVANLFRATPFSEKPYIESFLQENDPRKRQDILKYVPDDLAKALKKQWGTLDNKDATSNFVAMSSNELASGRNKYKFNETIMDPAVNLEDIELTVLKNEGLDAHEFGLGWNEQILRMQESQNQIQEGSLAELQYAGPAGPNISSAHVRGLINDLFNKSGIRASSQVYINDSGSPQNNINLIVRRDRSRTIINALRNRQRYGL